MTTWMWNKDVSWTVSFHLDVTGPIIRETSSLNPRQKVHVICEKKGPREPYLVSVLLACLHLWILCILQFISNSCYWVCTLIHLRLMRLSNLCQYTHTHTHTHTHMHKTKPLWSFDFLFLVFFSNLPWLFFTLNTCCRLDIFCPSHLPPFPSWNPTPSGMALGGGNFVRWLGYESGALISGISMEEASEGSIFFFFFGLFLLFLGPLPRHMEVPRLGV